jgi:hypothetical protein
MLDPINLGLLKPIATITESPDEKSLPLGHYYFFPFYSDTRLYHASLDKSMHQLFLEEYE